MPLSDLEISKDTLQTVVESGFDHVGRIAAIITSAGRDITRELGEWATDLFEMREAAARARADRAGAEDRAAAAAGKENP
ncbi:hypothetical protein [Conexibacter sp. DBS9H8]|uniref:hypothetical protein n=1 Tax=Conexibacter sp. DBS9H8 TaxID=2937801 RepID=UPI00200E6C3B|nr:hypothetical protein [Conexibacter sp. DBS9H8]